MLLYISQCVDCCRGLYDGAAFTIGNAADGTTAPIRLRVGVFMGCPLSPHLFTAAIAPLLHALKRLPDTGVKLTGVDRPGAAAYADDLKTFSSSVDGVKRKHAVVVDFLRWTGMAANPSKCSTMSVQRGARGVLKTCSGRRQMPNTWERALALLRRGEHAPASVRRRGTRWSRLPRGDDAVDRRHEIQGAADGGTERWTTLKTSSSASVAAPALASTVWATTCTSGSPLSSCRCCTQRSHAAGNPRRCPRAGRSAWCAYYTRRANVSTLPTGGRSACSRPFTSCTLASCRASSCAGWTSTTATPTHRRASGR
ncbi:hypothetical protein PC116_g26572 [Phytophthora cactorum]|nr:hypothetical protein Pcac1_g4146 [Phytophthora cactorum]KAG4224985.1 hypothetical protein PC116_g26572 [Phytophthora cactorum]